MKPTPRTDSPADRLRTINADLLAALKNAVRCGERDGMPGNPGSVPKWIAAARAAIARAERRAT